MKRFILCPNTDVSPALTMSDRASNDEMIWEDGHIIDPTDYDLSRLEFLCERLPSGRMTDYAVSDTGCPVVSQGFRECLDDLGVDSIQYFDASVIGREGDAPQRGYYAANVLGLIDCIDLDASEMDADEDANGEKTIIFRIDHLVLKTDPLELRLYRAAHFSQIILALESVKNEAERRGLVGVRFIEPERWDGFYGER